MIQVIIIAPGIAVRAGLRSLLGEDPQISVVGEAPDPRSLRGDLTGCDVVVWLPGSNEDIPSALAEIEKLRGEDTPALLLIHDDPHISGRLSGLAGKGWGLLSPDASQAELIAGVQALSEGLTVIHSAWVSQLIEPSVRNKNGKDKNVEELTSRELEILELLALGLTNKQIASRLKISAHTVKFHVSTIFSKMGTTNRVETVNLGLKKGLIVL